MSASGLELGYGFERGPLDTRSKYRKRKPRQRRLITRRAVFDQTLTACDIVTLLAAFAASYWTAVTCSRSSCTHWIPTFGCYG